MTQNSASVLSIDSSEILLSFDECQIFDLKLFKRVIVLREISDAGWWDEEQSIIRLHPEVYT